MIWESFLTLLTFFQSPSGPLPNPVQFNPIPEQVHPLFSSDGMGLFNPESPGPLSPQERELARKALHRGQKGGDMLFSHEEIEDTQVDKQFLFSWKKRTSRWPGYPGSGKIPYVIHKSINKKDRNLIQLAIDQFNTQTCVQFSPRKKEKDYIRIFNGKDEGCWSYVGKVGGAQELSLGNGCMYVGTIVHELGHTIGFLHEHQRHDRDNYITVYEGNITAGLEDQFNKTKASTEITYNAFDYNSIMIYGNYAFSIDEDKLMTMEALNGVLLTEPYDKPGLDNSDIERVKALYKCKK